MKVILVGFEGEYAVCKLPQYRKMKKSGGVSFLLKPKRVTY